jgi:hypothetical protein
MLRRRSVGCWVLGGGDGGGVGKSSIFYRLHNAHSTFDFLRDPGKGLSDIETERLRDCVWFEVWILDIMH